MCCMMRYTAKLSDARLLHCTGVVKQLVNDGGVHGITNDLTNKSMGFTKEFRDLAIGMSYFSIDMLSKLAANDFLRDPTLMIIVYLEWSSAAERLASSGHLSKAASSEVLALAETLALAPAACLDYFDAECFKSDQDRDISGLLVSGHILKNTSLMDPLKASYQRLPLAISSPRAPIVHAIRHGHKRFLEQPTVYQFLLDDWQGGGWRQYSVGPALLLATMLFGFSWVLVPLSCLLLLLTAALPPFRKWYEARFATHSTAMMRLSFGLVFVPAFRWCVAQAVDLSIAVFFSMLPMMPFHAQEDVDSSLSLELPLGPSPQQTTPSVPQSGSLLAEARLHFGGMPPSGSHDWWVYLYLWVVCTALLMQELGVLRDAIFQGIDWRALWRDTLEMLLHEVSGVLETWTNFAAAEDSAHTSPARRSSKRLLEISMTSFRRSATLRCFGRRSVRATFRARPTASVRARNSVIGRKVEHEVVDIINHGPRLLWKAVFRLVKGGVNCDTSKSYLNDDVLNLIVRMVCVITLAMSSTYSRETHRERELPSGEFRETKEVILSFTVLLLWVRKLQALKVCSLTSSFVYMVFQMIKDVLKWLIVYFMTVVAFSMAFRVLYRDRFMENQLDRTIGSETYSMDHCEQLDVALRGTLLHTAILMFEITFYGSGYWLCFHYSVSPIAGTLMHVLFTLFALVMLVNTLIAMMASTYTRVNDASFTNYVFEFSKLLIEWGDRVPAPFNVLGMPHMLCKTVCSAFHGVKLATSGATFVWRAQKGAQEESSWSLSTKSSIAQLKKHADELITHHETYHRYRSTVLQPKLNMEVVHRVHQIRSDTIQSKGKMLHFRKAISRYCRAQARGHGENTGCSHICCCPHSPRH